MRTTTRTLTTALLAAPLVAGAAVPATAAPPMRYTDSGTHVEASGQLLGEVDGLDGNVHQVFVTADESDDGTYGYGYVDSWACDDGVTQPYDPETGEERCDYVGFVELESFDAEIEVGKRLTSGVLTGMYSSVVWDCDEVECWPVPGDASFDVDVTVTADSTKPATARFMETYRDPATGYSYRGTRTQKFTTGTATGTVGSENLVDGWGLVGTYTFRAMEKY